MIHTKEKIWKIIILFKIQFIIDYMKPINILFACVTKKKIVIRFEINKTVIQIRMMTISFVVVNTLSDKQLSTPFELVKRRHLIWMFSCSSSTSPKLIRLRTFLFSPCSYIFTIQLFIIIIIIIRIKYSTHCVF